MENNKNTRIKYKHFVKVKNLTYDDCIKYQKFDLDSEINKFAAEHCTEADASKISIYWGLFDEEYHQINFIDDDTYVEFYLKFGEFLL